MVRSKVTSQAGLERTEQLELHQQAQLVKLLRRHLVGPHGQEFFAIPNGHVRGQRQEIQAFQEGVLAGASDLIIARPPPLMPHAVGVILEMKRTAGKSNDVRAEQRKFLRMMAQFGHVPLVGYGAQDAVALLCALGYFPEMVLIDAALPHLAKVKRIRALVARQAPTTDFIREADAALEEKA